MKILIFILSLWSHSLIWATNRDSEELGRSLANYQACSFIALDINDKQMFFYYQKMLNDTGLSILSFNADSAQLVYNTWERSEKLLLKIGTQNLRRSCLSRFDALSRKMLK